MVCIVILSVSHLFKSVVAKLSCWFVVVLLVILILTANYFRVCHVFCYTYQVNFHIHNKLTSFFSYFCCCFIS